MLGCAIQSSAIGSAGGQKAACNYSLHLAALVTNYIMLDSAASGKLPIGVDAQNSVRRMLLQAIVPWRIPWLINEHKN